MSASLMPHPMPAFFGTVAGVFGPMLDGYVYFYESGTTTPKDAYSDAAGTTPTANPIRLNARGESPTAIYLGTGAYSIALHDADDVEVWTVDNIEQAGADALAAALAAAAQAQAIADSLLDTAELYTLLENNRVPIGTIIPFGATSVPSGYLPCNGAAVSRTDYAGLFSVINTTWGAGNGATTFNLPDIRGEFVRGLDQGRGIDTGRAMASFQDHQLQSHTHNYSKSVTGAIKGDGSFDRILNWQTTASGDVNAPANSGAETRPRNVAVPYIIKAYDAPLSGANPPPATVTESTIARTLSLADRNRYIRCTNGSAVTITVPPESAVAFSVDTEVHVMQAGAGTVSFLAGSGVTINAVGLSISAQWRAATLKKVAANTWDLFGALS